MTDLEIKELKPAFEDFRGSIWDLLMGEKVDHIGMLISNNKSIRGKHYHKLQKQYTLVLKGKMKILIKDLQEKNSKIQEFILDKMQMILIPPFHYHALEALEDSQCLIFTTKSRAESGYEEDTFRIENIDEFEGLN